MYSNFISFKENYNRYAFNHPVGDSKTEIVITRELFVEIFSFLNLRDIATCSLVSKNFNALTKNRFVWKSLYQRFVPRSPALEQSADVYRAAVRIIYSNFNALQKDLTTAESVKLEIQISELGLKNAELQLHVSAIGDIFSQIVLNRLFFFGHSLLELMEAETIDCEFIREVSEKIITALIKMLYLTMTKEPEVTEQVLEEINTFCVAFTCFAKKKNIHIDSCNVQEISGGVFVSALLEKNLPLVNSVKALGPDLFSNSKKNSISRYALSLCFDKNYQQFEFLQNIEMAKLIMNVNPSNEELKGILVTQFSSAVSENDIDTAKMIVEVNSGQSVTTNASLNTLFKLAVSKENGEMAEFIRGLGDIEQGTIRESLKMAKANNKQAMKAYLKRLLKKDCVIS